MNKTVEILYISYNRPGYTGLSLDRLLATCPAHTRVWVWHNGDDQTTLEVVRSRQDHPRFHHLHHSPENRMLREPTNWFWKNAEGDLLGKVDDDCLMPEGWVEALERDHAAEPSLGIVGSWLFREEDIVPELVDRKRRTFDGFSIMANPWVGGSGYLMKRNCVEQQGLLRPKENFTRYCIRAAMKGWHIGWHVPFLYMDHMDDPRSEFTELRSDEEYLSKRGLTLAGRGIDTLAEARERTVRAAKELQECSSDPRDYAGWRKLVRRAKMKLNRHR